jgi:hypothetical protein
MSMTNKINQVLFTIAVACGLFFSCTKSTPFGADLLEDQLADLDTQEIPVICTIEQEEVQVTADRNASYSYFLCGQMNDPEFGGSSSEVFAQFKNISNPNYTNVRFDSAFLILPYAAAGVYGDTTTTQTLRIFQLADTIANSYNYKSTDNIAVTNEIGSVENFLPRPRTLAKILDTASTTVKAAHLKVPLSTAFGESLLAIDSTTMTNEFLFWKATRGLKITSTTSATPGAMLAFNLNSSSCFIRVYYTQNDTVRKTANYSLATGNKFMHFNHDYTGTPAAAAMATANPDLLYLQGMNGLRLKLEFPTAQSLDKVLINKAELELSALSSTLLLSEASQLATYNKTTDSTYALTNDANYSLTVGSNSFQYFGGFPEKEGGVQKYRMTMTKRFQEMVDATDGDPKSRTIYIYVYPRQLSAARSIIYGVNNPTNPLKMKLKYTKL